jgi:hypothetical protein
MITCSGISLDRSKQNVSLIALVSGLKLAQWNNLEDKVRKVPSITLKRFISELGKFEACLASK